MVGSATLVAVTVTVWELEIEAGAVYRPAAVMLPTTGLIDQVTAVLPVPLTAAVNVWFCDGSSVAVAGVTETETGGKRTTLALPEMAGFATLAAFTTMVCVAEIDEGAV